MQICKHRDELGRCNQPVFFQADKTKPSKVYTFLQDESAKEVSFCVWYPLKHEGLCYYHLKLKEKLI